MAADITPSASPAAAPAATRNPVDPTQLPGAPERARSTSQMLDAPKGAGLDEVVARQAQPLSRNTEFAEDPSTGRMVLRILSANGDVVRQIPSEEALELSRMVGRLSGSFVADKA